MAQILFVCTGNICRSPLAEAIARARLGQAGGVTFASAGTWAVKGSGATALAVEVGAEIGADLRGHRAAPLTPSVVVDARRVYGMTPGHVDAVHDLGIAASAELLDPAGTRIPDPYGADLAEYRTVRDLIAAAIDARLDEWRSWGAE